MLFRWNLAVNQLFPAAFAHTLQVRVWSFAAWTLEGGEHRLAADFVNVAATGDFQRVFELVGMVRVQLPNLFRARDVVIVAEEEGSESNVLSLLNLPLDLSEGGP